MSDRVKSSFVIFDIRALWRSALSVRVPGCQKLQMTTRLNPVCHRMLCSCTYVATVGVKGLIIVSVDDQLELCVDTRRAISSSSAAGPSGTTASVDRAAAAAAGSPPAGTGTGETPGHTGELSDTQRHTHCPASASTRTVTQPHGSRDDSSRMHPADDQRTLRRHRINQRTTASLGPQGRSAQLSSLL